MKRLMPRALVVLTILIVLGAGGYAGQVWWARKVASGAHCVEFADGRLVIRFGDYHLRMRELVQAWQACPWYGEVWRNDLEMHASSHWFPRRTFHEALCIVTGQDLINDPSAWEAWFEAHPNLVWDAKQKRLVEPKP